VELLWPFRDVLAPDLIRLVAAWQSQAGSCSLGTCAASGSDPTLRPAQCASDLSCRLDFGVTTVITSRVIMWGRLVYVSDASHRFPPRSAAATVAVALLWAHMMWDRLPKCRVSLPFAAPL
jgi:hypothetical protein